MCSWCVVIVSGVTWATTAILAVCHVSAMWMGLKVRSVRSVEDSAHVNQTLMASTVTSAPTATMTSPAASVSLPTYLLPTHLHTLCICRHGSGGQFSPSVWPHNPATGFWPPSATVVSAEPFSHGTGTLRCLQKEMATYRHWSVSLWWDPDDVSHCRILSSDQSEWRIISATLCGWRCCFVADQLWFMTRIREEDRVCGGSTSALVRLNYSITLIILFLVSHFNFLFIPCGILSWLLISFLLHIKYTLSYRITYKLFKWWNCPTLHYVQTLIN